jgi:hypothetical protein
VTDWIPIRTQGQMDSDLADAEADLSLMRLDLEGLQRDIALIHLAMAMLLGCSAGALVISLLGAVA